MPETLLSPVITKLVELLAEEVKSVKGVHRKVKNLKNELEILEPLLRDAEAKCTRGELGATAKVWLKQLREEAERIEDVIDEYTCCTEQHRQEQLGFLGSLRKAGRCVKSLKTRHFLASEIQEVEESLRKIKDRGLSYGLRPFEQGSSSSGGEGISRIDSRIGSLFLDDNELVGIGSVSAELVSSLVEGSSRRMLVSLVGEGGIGKTTLAKKVYNDVVEKGCFETHAWVTVSQSYDINKILKILTTKICPSGGEIIALEEAFTLLRTSLQEKRYAIVFDDVWQTDFWIVIKHAFPIISNGSRIIVTTRKATVVQSFHSPSCEMIVKELKTWPTEHAWKLFCKKAFPVSSCPPELEGLSIEIMSKCQGLPLAVVAVAGLLSKEENSKLEWQRVLDNLNNEFEEHRELSGVSQVLMLSYLDLPYNLKICFLYFGLFPEDYSIIERRLWRIWIAEGFIMLRKEKSLEDIADEYLTELIDRNLVSFELKHGSIKRCRVHDMIREMIKKRAGDLCFYQLFDQNKPNFKEKSRRLVIHDTTRNVLESVSDSKIRSIVLVSTNKVSNSFIVALFKKHKLLKVVDFEPTHVENLPKEVGNLLHLKSLSLKGSKVKTLPKSIGKLRNLQTLDVRYTLVWELPREINKLHRLRHLLCGTFDLETIYSVKPYIGQRVHEGIGILDELRTLSRVEAHSSDVGFIKELQRLSKLKCLGILKVSATMCKHLVESIEKLNDLEELFVVSINNEEVLDLNCISCPPLLLSYFQLTCRLHRFPTWVAELQNLKGVELNFSRLVDDPLKCLKGLPNLEYLDMYKAYDGEELRFEEGSFPKLKQLCLRRFEGLKVMKIERAALPRLEELEFGHSPLIKEIPCDLQRLKKLKSLKIYDMPKEFVTALQPEGGSQYCKIQHIPSVTFLYYQGKGWSNESFKLGSSKLLQHLDEQQ